MKSKLILSMALLLTTGSSFANCLPQYQQQDASTKASDSDDGMAIAFPCFIPVTAPSLVTDLIEEDKLEKVIDLINDADAGNGLVLQSFVADSGLSTVEAAEFVRQADESGVLCSEQNLLSYDDIVSLAKKN